jgi:hypothetical protein
MRLMALMVAGDGRPKALWWCCERRKRKDVCQTYRVFDDSNVSRRQERTQQDLRHPMKLIQLMPVAVAVSVGRPTRLVVVVSGGGEELLAKLAASTTAATPPQICRV